MQQHSYLGVTCHFIDNSWIMQKRILAFRVFDGSHSAQNIYKLMKIIFEEYSIENKIFAISFDNATNNTVVIPHLINLCNPYFDGRFFHQRCVFHVLNLCVQTDLTLLKDSITPIRNAFYYLWKHQNNMK